MQVWGGIDGSRKRLLHAAVQVMSSRALAYHQEGEEGRTELKVTDLLHTQAQTLNSTFLKERVFPHGAQS